MPVFDTPVTTDDVNVRKVLGQKMPVLLFLYDSRKGADKPLEDAVQKAAQKHAGELLIARVDAATNLQTHREYGQLALPAVVALEGQKVKSKAGNVRPADVRAHIDYLLGKGPQPIPTDEAPKATNSAASASKGAEHVTDSNFKRVVLESKVPVLVDFWAPWCGPCRMIAPMIEQAAKEYAGRARVVKLNVDENPMTAQQFQVQSIPTLLVFKNGKPIRRQVGANPTVIRSLIEDALA